ncbi:hypothetical protein GQ43DRAFT_76255 [Delitschia confertaspora ATCC 74209]|uniref:Uncharacterized protein n=1 Tax=Delitschia confertaspora ATCC 74209 TaxID=1513339 RepID=A0A9P4JX04_9PLEO|nr:hypothetical protein GQ43DRAFT_76255 [Delitschia confertaspora ATCC 74209]
MAEWRRNPDAPLLHPWDRARIAAPISSSSTLPAPHIFNPPTTSVPNTSSPQPAKSTESLVTKRYAREATTDQRQAASAGKLVEVDLGPQARLENIRRTEAALKRMMGGDTVAVEEESGKGKKRDHGQRGVKRRNSRDEERDRKVEEFMKQAPVYHFELEKSAPESDQPTDEVMAEQFQREFLETLENQRIRKPPVPTGAKGAEERAKGPKLGGSRSARAMMKAKEEEAKR